MCAHLSGTVGMPGKLGAGTVLHCPARHWSRWSIPLFAVIALISFRLTLSCLLKDQTMSAAVDRFAFDARWKYGSSAWTSRPVRCQRIKVATAKLWRASWSLGRRALDPGGGSSPARRTSSAKVCSRLLWPGETPPAGLRHGHVPTTGHLTG
jgi:hypothetical protein